MGEKSIYCLRNTRPAIGRENRSPSTFAGLPTLNPYGVFSPAARNAPAEAPEELIDYGWARLRRQSNPGRSAQDRPDRRNRAGASHGIQ